MNQKAEMLEFYDLIHFPLPSMITFHNVSGETRSIVGNLPCNFLVKFVGDFFHFLILIFWDIIDGSLQAFQLYLSKTLGFQGWGPEILEFCRSSAP